MDLVFKLHQNPSPHEHPEADYYTFKFETVASQMTLSNGIRRFSIETLVARKSSNLGLKGTFTYETHRSEMNSMLVVKYGENKEVSATIYYSHPRKTLTEINTHINVTIPSFTPMILALDIMEQHPHDYKVRYIQISNNIRK